jgi:hypothetical protein
MIIRGVKPLPLAFIPGPRSAIGAEQVAKA